MSVLSDAIKAIDPTPDKTKELTLSLNLISELSESKVREFQNEVDSCYRTSGTPENRKAPITFIISTHSEYRAFVKDDVGKIQDEVGEAIKLFTAGGSEGIVNGMTQLVSTGLKTILGEGQATQREMRSYFLTVQSRALVRYDFLAWRRNIYATGITNKMESALAVFASKASIDVHQLDLNTFLLAYEDQLHRMGFEDSEVIEYIEAAEEAFNRLRNSDPIPPVFSSNNNAIRQPKSAGTLAYFEID